MKQTLFMTSSMLLTLLLGMTGCNSSKKMQKEVIETAIVGYVNPQQLEAVNGTVNFNYTTSFAPKEFNKRTVLKITPKLQYGKQMMSLQPIYLQGEKVKTSDYPVISHRTGTSVTESLSFPFKPGMENSTLWADVEAIHGKKSVMLTPVVLNENGIKVWQQPAFTLNGVEYVPAMTEMLVEDVPATAVGVVSGYVMFPLGKSTISSAEQHSAIMTQASQAMKEILADTNASITNMIVYVSNSPEGSEELNKKLATHRFQAAKTFFEKDLDLNNTPMAKNPKFVIQQTVDENWNGLYLLLENSELPNKMEMIQKLKNAPNLSKRSELLNHYIAKVPELKNSILPTLRRADFFVFYTVPTIVEEDVEITYFVPQLNEKTPAVTTHNNWQLLNDLAVAAINNHEYHKAKKLLEAAIVLKQDAAINNNLGVVHAHLGNRTEASKYFNKAQLRKEARYNMGLVLTQNGEYRKAIPYLKEHPDANLAFAQLMNNDNRAALDTFHKLKLKNATDYYMMAVAAARTKNNQEMTTCLGKAIEMQPNLKKWAASDIAFYPYKNDPAYQQLIK